MKGALDRVKDVNSRTTLSPYTLPHLREFMLSLKNDNYSKKTLDNYARDLEIFSAFLFYIETSFKDITKLDIIEYKGFLRDQNYIPILHAFQKNEELTQEIINKSKSEISEKKKALYKGQLSDNSVNRMLSALRRYLTFLDDIDKEPPLPATAIKMIKAEKKEKQVAEFEELVKLLEYPTEFENDPIVSARNRAILELIFSTGMRISEVVSLDRDMIRIENNAIADSKIYVMGKGKKQRFVYLTERAIHYLNEYLKFRTDEYPAFFIPTKGTRKATENPYIVRISQNYIQMKIAEYRKRLGIIVPTSAHSLRHGFATYLAEEGANPAAIQRLLGHSSLQTTSRYVHASDKFAETAHREHHPLN
ncbi:tyrosine-type recombinase/integrase [Candidatus Dojkabacteria bacterium]|uniref:Tyrosine-type recombinase/integrase n=1 Tax=Candidatus Dojkabacteria bacterium TaxID=2099670 RepID=A0A955RL23_9BACT|nr:tyrosine-type recombinase/integrase [Candidatus Dojkabacteria bacterium]